MRIYKKRRASLAWSILDYAATLTSPPNQPGHFPEAVRLPARALAESRNPHRKLLVNSRLEFVSIVLPTGDLAVFADTFQQQFCNSLATRDARAFCSLSAFEQ
jgi:hypothetical protein